jgi:NAD(P)-dependent dehydrogenase (short-subunit alcohol dehydrogenase family)
MDIAGSSAVVTGGASGLGRATAQRLAKAGAAVTILDLPASAGAEVAAALGGPARFAPADVTDTAQAAGPLRVLVHCAGQGGPIRLVDRDGHPGSLEVFERIVRINLIGTFNVLRLAAARMAANEPAAGSGGCACSPRRSRPGRGRLGRFRTPAPRPGWSG